ncbi:hypothetical protein BDV93DRAFT_525763 [Ceratobasidium sp. AG-I]|nr:hypothetical protein BDV93DRAFT_525763 [Ceratobasidium sp. AG-I]
MLNTPGIIIEPFVPPPRTGTPSSAPSGPRLLPQTSATSLRSAYAESPRTGLASLRSQPSNETLQLGRKSPSSAGSHQDVFSPSKFYPPSLDSSRLGPNDYFIDQGPNTGTTASNDSLPLLTPPHPKRQMSVATQLPTVPIPPSVSEQTWATWAVGGKGLMSDFEPVPVKPLVIHTFLCAGSFPVVFLFCSAASGLSLFWARAIVGAVCGVVGLALGYNLINLSRRGMEATLWATIIHESMRPDGGVTLEQLNDYSVNPGSPWAAMRLLFRRAFYHKGARRNHRRRYDRTPWTLFIIVFLIAAAVSACLVFVFGRIVDIYTKQERQFTHYYETTVAGDLSQADIDRAAALTKVAYSNFNISWSLTPFSSSGLLPVSRSFAKNRLDIVPQATHNITDVIYIADTYLDQLEEGGLGIGTFDDQKTTTLSKTDSLDSEAAGQVLRWPKWGIRSGCQILDNLDKYLVPVSSAKNMTYLFVPKTALYSLFSSMDIAYPTLPAANFTALMEPGDTPPANISEADTAVTSKWWQNGVAHSFKSVPLSMGKDGAGWLQLEIVLVRLNQAYAPNSSFGVFAYPDEAYKSSPVGYDVAICIEEYKPYIVDAYNNSAGSPSTIGLLHRGLDFDQAINVPQPTWIRDGAQWGINSTGKFAAFAAAHANARNTIVKDNGRDFAYVPNPTLVSFSNGSGPLGYTKLDPARVATALARTDSQHLLPYLAGSQPVIARCYPDKTVAYIKISKLWLGVLLLIMLLLGYIVAIFVPRLPLGLPARDFGVFSWLAAIEGDAIVGIPSGVGRYEHLDELKRRGNHIKVRYAAPNEGDWALPETERAHREFFERHYTMQ